MTRPLRIVCAIHGLSGGGAEHLLAGLASRLAERHEVTLLTLAAVESDRYAVGPRVHRRGLDLISESHSLWQAVRANGLRVRSL
ncbi:MAG: glycosyltransferase family 4 protein, partial [Planctomycetota bacterium]